MFARAKGLLVPRNLPPMLSLAIMALAVMPASAAQEAASPATVELEIEAQALGDALKLLARKADLQIVFLPRVVANRRSPAVEGRMSAEDALRTMLAGSQLEFVRTPEGVVIIRERAQAASESSPVTPIREKEDKSRLRTRERPRSVMPRELVAESTPPSSLGDLVVTGTHLRVAPVGAQVISIDREDFERMGFSTVQDVLRTLPQNFGGGATEDTLIGREARTNTADGYALNLRGLGSSSTLVLLNGRRMAGSGSEGSFTDISNIPLTAVERIDILPDGASAFYGSDAVGGVVNIILRGDYAGAETQARAGSAPDGAIGEFQGGQVFGGKWGSGNALLAMELFQRDNLLADDRAQAASDLRRFGGTNFDTRNGNPGTIVIGAQTWAIPAGQDGTALTPADLVPGTQNLFNRREGADLLPQQKRASVVAAVHQKAGETLDFFADALYSRREFESVSVGVPIMLVVPPSNPFHVHPAGAAAPVVVAYNFRDDLGRVTAFGSVDVLNVAAGASSLLGEEWRITGYGAYAREEQVQRQRNLISIGPLLQALADPDPSTAFNPFGDGSNTNPLTLAGLRTSSRLGVDSQLRSAHVAADGPLFDLGAGDIELAFGVDYRRQSLESSNVSQVNVGGTNLRHSSDRSVAAAFGELLVPLFSGERNVPGLASVHLSLAGRFEDYSDYGDTAVPAAGLVWSPAPGFALRGTWSRSFKAPSLADLDESQNGSQVAPLRDTASSTGFTSTLLWFGKNADLEEETARSWTVGAELRPGSLPGFKLALTWFDIEFNDRIQMSGFNFGDLGDPSIADTLDRDPTMQERERVCSRSAFFGNPADCLNAPIGAILDIRLQNISLNRTRGIDVIGAYDIDGGSLGTFDVRLNGTYLREFSQAAVAGAPLIDLVDTQSNPLQLRLRGSLTWERRGLELSAFVNYADRYRDTASVPNRTVGSWTTWDLQLGYDTGTLSEGPFADMRVSLSVENAFDKDPPFLNNPMGIGYDEENADLLGRIVRLHVRKNW